MSISYSSGPLNYASEENSTKTELPIGGVYVGSSVNVQWFKSMSVSIFSDVDSAENGLALEFSTDNIVWGRYSNTYTIRGGQARFICVQISTMWARVSYTNGITAQSEFELQTCFFENRESQDILYPAKESNINSILSMYKIFGTNNNIAPIANSLGMPMVEIGSSTDTFGSISVSTKSIKNTSSFLYNINSEIYDTVCTGSGTARSSNGMALLQTGTNSNSSVLIDTIDYIRFTPGKGLMLSVSPVFGTSYSDTQQWVGLGTDSNGFYIGYNGTAFSIWHRNGGIDNYIANTNWNEDTLDGYGKSKITLNPTKGNVFFIQILWLFGNIKFFVENPITTQMTLFHTINYSNLNIIPNLTEPAYKSRIIVLNGQTNRNIQLQCSSATLFTSGKINYNVGILNCISTSKTIVRKSWKHLMTIRNKSTYLLKKNNIPIVLTYISITTTTSASTEIQIVKNASLNLVDPDNSDNEENAAVWSDINTNNSVVEVTKHNETITDGKLISSFFVTMYCCLNQNLLPLELQINPGESYSFVAYNEKNNSEISTSVTWRELF